MATGINMESRAQSYAATAGLGILVTAVATVINPIAGAAWGAFFITNIGTSMAADQLGCGRADSNVAAKVAKSVGTMFLSLVAAFATVCCLTGAVVAFTPGMIAVGVSLLCLSALASLSAHHRVGIAQH